MSPPRIGDLLDGRYVLDREIARGSMGIVFEARHVATGRRVAVKLMATDVARKPDLCARFEREARCLGAINHPGVVQVLDAGAAHGEPYMVLEMLDGRTLEGVMVARGSLPPDEALGFAVELCEAMARVHAAGVVHRDLKPSNVFVALDGRGRQALKILDFGIASFDESAGPPTPRPASSDRLTWPGSLLGTPEYMAPEQLMARVADERSDVYAVGVLLFEMLTGAVPFAGSFPEVLLAVHAAPSPPSILDRRPELSRGLAEVIARALATEPTQRHPSMASFAGALQAVTTPWRVAPSATRARSAEDAAAWTPRVSSAQGASTALDIDPEPRCFGRRPYVTPVVIRVGDESIVAQSEDISEGGLLVLAPTLCLDGADVEVELTLPEGRGPVRLPGIARWSKTGRRGSGALGIELLEPPPSVRRAIRLYVARARPRRAEATTRRAPPSVRPSFAPSAG